MTSLVVHGSELLVTEGMGPISWGCYPMAPWAGRIRDGAFTFDGREHQLPLTMPPNAIHGTVLDRAWTVVGDGRIAIDLGPDWPFAGRVTQHVVLGKGGLKVTMTLEADEPMPATIGWHPWFRRILTGTCGRGRATVGERAARLRARSDVRTRSRRPADRPADRAVRRAVGRLLHGRRDPAPTRVARTASPWS